MLIHRLLFNELFRFDSTQDPSLSLRPGMLFYNNSDVGTGSLRTKTHCESAHNNRPTEWSCYGCTRAGGALAHLAFGFTG
jgi:hypothetical protein